MAESQQGQGRGSTRVGEQGGTRHDQQGDQQGSQQGRQTPHVEPDHENHGQSVAAWTAVGIIFVGSLIMSIAVVIASVWLFVVGAVIAVAGAISGKVLSAMGFGSSGQPGH